MTLTIGTVGIQTPPFALHFCQPLRAKQIVKRLIEEACGLLLMALKLDSVT